MTQESSYYIIEIIESNVSAFISKSARGSLAGSIQEGVFSYEGLHEDLSGMAVESIF